MFVLVALPLVVTHVARTFASRGETSRVAEARFRELAETIPAIIWTALPGKGIDFCNRRFQELTGFSMEQSLGWGWKNALHPDDLPIAIQNWEKARTTGAAMKVEYRFRTAAGDFRWHLVRANPLRDYSGNVVKWFGSCTDIDDQRRNQEELEEQVRHHTAALIETNARLESEMRERALAQQELNQQNERMVRELTKRTNRVTTMSKMAELLQSCADLKDTFSVIAGMAPKVFPELRGAVLLFNSGRVVLEVAASWNDCVLPAPVFGPQDCWAVRSGHMHLVKAGDHTAECRHGGTLPHSYVCIPLMSQGAAIGILHFQCIGPTDLTEAELLLANTFAEQIGLSISNLRLREALRNQSIRDPLTGLFNRRYLEEMMERETRRAVRAEAGLGVLMLDLDHFKNFNDTHGHDAGDTVLREAAAFFAKSVRSEDIVCRFGGEEFIILLPMADLKATHARAERIRSKIRELKVLHQGRAVGVVTVSVGVAALPQHGTASKVLLDAADAALYRAKHEGRDRVVVAEAPAASDPQPNAAGAGKS